ncbi:MAG: hypothetical protein GY751_10265, partial [Bacteroidetes bacterium]|nr:hypothetical protein [Bacteroidota bacterium]
VNIGITLPDGVSVADVTKGALISSGDYTIVYRSYTGGAKIIVYSASDTISADGVLLNLELSVAQEATPGNYQIGFESNNPSFINSSHAISNENGNSSVTHDITIGYLTINNGDSDGDFIVDTWEMTHFGDLTHSGTFDSDGDGLTDKEEFDAGTDPNVTDSDGDGIPDGWEVDNGLNPGFDDSLADSDSDGFTNIDEYLGGTNPGNDGDIPNFLEITENFESGDLSYLNWTTYSTGPWFVGEDNANNGTHSVGSPILGDKEKGILETILYCQEGELSFWYKVSSEEDYDYLKFYIDGEFTGGWSGEVPYTKATYDITKGKHVFKWVYSKDGADSDGEDSVWIDDIVFPGSLDSDSDGMPNSWEKENNLLATVNDAFDDEDGDGFSNYAEFIAESNPNSIMDIPFYTDKKDDFETGGFSKFPWTITGDAQWSVADSVGYNNTKGCKTPQLLEKQKASMETTMYCEEGDVSFMVAVDLGEFDTLHFYINDTISEKIVGGWEGNNIPFTLASFPVDAGIYTFKWVYSKTSTGTSGGAWLDDITFPGSVDSDNDKMPDGWEIANNLKPLFNDAGVDGDGDGFVNLLEYLGDTDPNTINDTAGYEAPVADAGADQSVNEGQPVTLDGGASSNIGVGIVSYQWRQIDGKTVTLSDSGVVRPTFVAPPVVTSEVLKFELFVEDVGGLTDSSTVEITINDNGIVRFTDDVTSFVSATSHEVGMDVEGGGLTMLNNTTPETYDNNIIKPANMEYGIFDFEVRVENPGDTATVTV